MNEEERQAAEDKKRAEAEERARAAAAKGLRKYRIDPEVCKPSYRGDFRDAKGNKIRSFLFVNLDMIPAVEMKIHYQKQIEEEFGENDIVAKPGEVIELPAPIYTVGASNETAMLLSAGVIKEVK